MPFTILGVLFANRTSWFADVGVSPDKFPATWDEYRAIGKQMKAKDHPYGQTLAHAFGDGPAFWYPYLWSWGGKEVEADGKTVALNTKETIDLVKFAVAFWKECFDEGGMSWDDAGNNRAFLANTISSTSNGASIYLLAKAKADTYMTEKGKPLKDDIFHAPLPKGPAGQFSYHVPFSNLVPTYGKNQKAAKDFLRWFHSKEIYGEWFTSQQGFSTGTTRMWEDDPVWKVDPIMAPFRTAAESGHFAGYAGPAGRAAAEAISKFIIVDMYAKAVQGASAEERRQMGARRDGEDLRLRQTRRRRRYCFAGSAGLRKPGGRDAIQPGRGDTYRTVRCKPDSVADSASIHRHWSKRTQPNPRWSELCRRHRNSPPLRQRPIVRLPR